MSIQVISEEGTSNGYWAVGLSSLLLVVSLALMLLPQGWAASWSPSADVLAAIDKYVATGATVAGVSGSDLRALLLAINQQECASGNSCVSNDGGYGAYQITGSANMKACGVTASQLLSDASAGLACAVSILQSDYNRCGDLSSALTAYNGGKCTANNNAINQAYAASVLAKMANLGGDVTASSSGSTTQALLVGKCATPGTTEGEWAEGFRTAFANSALVNAAMYDSISATARSMDIKKSYCIGNMLKWMDWSSMETMLLGIIKQVILDMVNQVFNYVCSEAQSLVSSVLSKLCIPRPSFGAINLGLTADGLETCNGISLAQLKSATGSVIVPLTTESNQAINKYFNALQSKTK